MSELTGRIIEHCTAAHPNRPHLCAGHPPARPEPETTTAGTEAVAPVRAALAAARTPTPPAEEATR